MGGQLPSRADSLLRRVLLVTVITACGADSGPGGGRVGFDPQRRGDTTASQPTTTDEPTPSTDVRTHEAGHPNRRLGSEFGQMLFDSIGQAIYLFDVETTSKPVLRRVRRSMATGADPG